jgi:hypothetical protein
MDEHFDDKSFMGVHGLLRALRLVGCSKTIEELAVATYEPKLAAELAYFTDVRHRLVHRGERVDVSKPRAWECTALVRRIAVFVDADVVERYRWPVVPLE